MRRLPLTLRQEEVDRNGFEYVRASRLCLSVVLFISIARHWRPVSGPGAVGADGVALSKCFRNACSDATITDGPARVDTVRTLYRNDSHSLRSQGTYAPDPPGTASHSRIHTRAYTTLALITRIIHHPTAAPCHRWSRFLRAAGTRPLLLIAPPPSPGRVAAGLGGSRARRARGECRGSADANRCNG